MNLSSVVKYLCCTVVLTVSLPSLAGKRVAGQEQDAAILSDPYCLDSIDGLYVKNPDLALIRIDSLRRRCEAKNWEGCERARLEMINSIIYTYKEDPAGILRYAYEVLAVTDKLSDDNEVFWHLMALQYISEAYSTSGNWFMTARTLRKMEMLAQKYGGRYVWYESVAQMIRSQMLSQQGKTDLALQSIDKARAVMERDTSRSGRIIAFQNRLDTERFRAEINALAGRNEQAKDIYESLLGFVETGDSTNLSKSLYDLTRMRVYASLCRICQELGQSDSASAYYHKVRDLQSEYQEGHSLTEPLSYYLFQSGNDKELEHILLPVLKQATENNVYTSQMADYMRIYIRMLHRSGRLAESTVWSERYMQFNDSLHTQAARRAYDEFVVSYKAKEQEEVILMQESKLFRRQAWVISLSGFAILLLILFVVSYRFLVKYRQNNRFLSQRIRETNAAFARLTQLSVMPVVDDANPQTPVISVEQTTVRELRDWLLDGNRFLDKQFSQREILNHCGLSHDTLNKRFQSVLGMSLPEYITVLRLDYACSLLTETNLTIDAVASDSGFNSTRTFLRQFKSKYNLSPTQYRRV